MLNVDEDEQRASGGSSFTATLTPAAGDAAPKAPTFDATIFMGLGARWIVA